MPRSKRDLQYPVTIDGIPLIWNLHREQQLSTADGWRGVAIHVRVVEGVRRELHLEYPAVQVRKIVATRTDRVEVNIRPPKVEAHIRQAMEAGWDPMSRGKPYVYEVQEEPY